MRLINGTNKNDAVPFDHDRGMLQRRSTLAVDHSNILQDNGLACVCRIANWLAASRAPESPQRQELRESVESSLGFSFQT